MVKQMSSSLSTRLYYYYYLLNNYLYVKGKKKGEGKGILKSYARVLKKAIDWWTMANLTKEERERKENVNLRKLQKDYSMNPYIIITIIAVINLSFSLIHLNKKEYLLFLRIYLYLGII